MGHPHPWVMAAWTLGVPCKAGREEIPTHGGTPRGHPPLAETPSRGGNPEGTPTLGGDTIARRAFAASFRRNRNRYRGLSAVLCEVSLWRAPTVGGARVHCRERMVACEAEPPRVRLPADDRHRDHRGAEPVPPARRARRGEDPDRSAASGGVETRSGTFGLPIPHLPLSPARVLEAIDEQGRSD